MSNWEMGEDSPVSAADFARYANLAIDFAEGTLSPEREAEVRERMRTDEDFREIVEPIIESFQAPATSTQQERDDDWKELRARIGLDATHPRAAAETEEPDERARRRGVVGHIVPVAREPWRRWAMTAAAMLVGAIALPGIRLAIQAVRGPGDLVLSAPLEAVLRLSDNTLVQLEPGSTLQYRSSMTRSGTRALELQGEARFQVAHESAPLVVRTPAIEIVARDARFVVTVGPGYTEVAVEDGEIDGHLLQRDGSVGNVHPRVTAGFTIRVRNPRAFDITGNLERDVPEEERRVTMRRQSPMLPPMPAFQVSRP